MLLVDAVDDRSRVSFRGGSVWVPPQGRRVNEFKGRSGKGVGPCNSQELKDEGRRVKGSVVLWWRGGVWWCVM